MKIQRSIEFKKGRTMTMTINERAEVLIQALPYIQEYTTARSSSSSTAAAPCKVKELERAVMGDLRLLQLVGIRVVLVHGGGPEISEMLKKLGKQTEFIDGLRVTDRDRRGGADGAGRQGGQ